MPKITDFSLHDLRFPTSKTMAGSDAMNPDGDYSAAYVELHTDDPDLSGHGYTFTIGRGNDLCLAAMDKLAPKLVGVELSEMTANLGKWWRVLAGDTQMRWVGPEKGVTHLALAGVMNAVWDMWGKSEGKPVWRLAAEMPAEQLADTVDYRHISDAITRDEAVAIIAANHQHREARIAELIARGYPAYTTSAGWLGYSDEKIRTLCRQAIADGWNAIKIKVGRDLKDDIRRCRVVREEIGPDRLMMIDANQVWEIDQAIDWVKALAGSNPYWIEEPVSPDDILGHRRIKEAIAPIKVATGEHCHNRIMFKQFLQADALDIVQFDNCRLGSVNETLAVQLMAAKFGTPVCPHAGGVGLCEVGQHVAMMDYLCVSGRMDDRMLEHAGQLQEHFVNPIRIEGGRYMVPEQPGFSTEIKLQSRKDYSYPEGSYWRGEMDSRAGA
jgi:L-fuconate dehydratase